MGWFHHFIRIQPNNDIVMTRTITIGRSRECDIIVPDSTISRVHARISAEVGHYVYENIGKNGSTIAGRCIHGKVHVPAGTDIMLAGRIPLPWVQVYAILPLHNNNASYTQENLVHIHAKDDSIGVGWGILAFLVPIAGWIMWAVWKDDTPHRASQACTIAWISFIINMITILSSL